MTTRRRAAERTARPKPRTSAPGDAVTPADPGRRPLVGSLPIGNRATARFVQRARSLPVVPAGRVASLQRAPTRSKLDPAGHATYGAWLQALPAGAVDETAVDITGEARLELPDLAALVTDLKADCADVGIVLRHYWLRAHGRTGVIHGRDPKDTKKRKKWKIGAGVNKRQLRLVLVYIGTAHFQTGQRSAHRQLDWYGGKKPLLDLRRIVDAGLEPGDVLMWKKNAGITGNFSGHFQTVQRINLHELPKGVQGPTLPNSIDVLQGTMYQGVRAGELQAKRLTFTLLTGQDDGAAAVSHEPGGEEHFVGAGKWR